MYSPLIFIFPFIIQANPKDFLGLLEFYIVYLFAIAYLFAAFWFYRIELFEDVLIDRGLKKTKRTPVNDITKLKLETGWGKQKWLWAPTLRPFNRLAVYYTLNNQEKYIDISLNHFHIEKVRELLNALLCLRPDLAIPKNFPKEKKKRTAS
jgi:hypothetical protein